MSNLKNSNEIAVTDINISKDRITSKTEIPPIEPIVTIGEAYFAVKGDISFISGKPKAGKSTICGLILATALLKKTNPYLDTLGIQSSYCEGNEVVYIDTEQPKQYTKKTLETVNKFLNVFDNPNNFHVYNLREYTKKQKYEYVQKLFDVLNNAHLWIIDGIADLIIDNNNPIEAEEKINWFMTMASKRNTTIILILHENFGSEKMRGHTGSEAARKCGGSISIIKDVKKGIHWIESKMIRGSKDFENIYFRFDDKEKRFVSCEPEMVKKIKEDNDPKKLKFEKYHGICKNAFVGGSVSPKELIKRLCLYASVKATAANNYRKEMLELDIIVKDSDGNYRWKNPEQVSIKQEELPL